MMTLNLYALMDIESELLHSFSTSSNDKEVCEMYVKMLSSSFDSLKDDKEKSMFLSNVRKCNIVRVGSIDLLTHDLTNDFNVLVFLKDFMKEINDEV